MPRTRTAVSLGSPAMWWMAHQDSSVYVALRLPRISAFSVSIEAKASTRASNVSGRAGAARHAAQEQASTANAAGGWRRRTVTAGTLDGYSAFSKRAAPHMTKPGCPNGGTMRVGLFVPCYIDAFFPEVGIATLELLERLGCDVDYPVRSDLLRPADGELRLPGGSRRHRAQFRRQFFGVRPRRVSLRQLRQSRPLEVHGDRADGRGHGSCVAAPTSSSSSSTTS